MDAKSKIQPHWTKIENVRNPFPYMKLGGVCVKTETGFDCFIDPEENKIVDSERDHKGNVE